MRAAPLSIVCVSNERSSAVAVCAALSGFVQRTRPPLRTATVTGLYLNDLMSTVAIRTAGPEGVEAVEVVAGFLAGCAAAIPSPAPPPEPPQPARAPRAATAVRAAATRISLTSPRGRR